MSTPPPPRNTVDSLTRPRYISDWEAAGNEFAPAIPDLVEALRKAGEKRNGPALSSFEIPDTFETKIWRSLGMSDSDIAALLARKAEVEATRAKQEAGGEFLLGPTYGSKAEDPLVPMAGKEEPTGAEKLIETLNSGVMAMGGFSGVNPLTGEVVRPAEPPRLSRGRPKGPLPLDTDFVYAKGTKNLASPQTPQEKALSLRAAQKTAEKEGITFERPSEPMADVDFIATPERISAWRGPEALRKEAEAKPAETLGRELAPAPSGTLDHWMTYAAKKGLTQDQALKGAEIVMQNADYYAKTGYEGLVRAITTPEPAPAPSAPGSGKALARRTKRPPAPAPAPEPEPTTGEGKLARVIAGKFEYTPPKGTPEEQGFRPLDAAQRRGMEKSKTLLDKILAGIEIKPSEWPARVRNAGKMTPDRNPEGANIIDYLRSLGKSEEDVNPASISWEAYNARMNSEPGSRVGLKPKPEPVSQAKADAAAFESSPAGQARKAEQDRIDAQKTGDKAKLDEALRTEVDAENARVMLKGEATPVSTGNAPTNAAEAKAQLKEARASLSKLTAQEGRGDVEAGNGSVTTEAGRRKAIGTIKDRIVMLEGKLAEFGESAPAESTPSRTLVKVGGSSGGRGETFASRSPGEYEIRENGELAGSIWPMKDPRFKGGPQVWHATIGGETRKFQSFSEAKTWALSK